jgi:hydrogenase maturation protein HypF
VQHHAAHASSLAGEHPDIENWLVFTWDGVGYGSDGTLWGGEALAGRPGDWNRVASFRPFHLVGGDKAGREPWRSAAALQWAVGAGHAREKKSAAWRPPTHNPVGAGHAREEKSAAWRPPTHYPLLRQVWERRINTFETSAAGRLFDAAAALVLGRNMASFEGQGPMELENIAADGCAPLSLPLAADANGILRSDWAPLLDVLADRGLPPDQRAGIFHESMAQARVDQALKAGESNKFDAVGLSGGVFQNRRLTERVVELLQAHGVEVRLHRDIPANDGGLCFGQVIEAMAMM